MTQQIFPVSGNLGAANATLPNVAGGAPGFPNMNITALVWGTFVGTVALQISKAGGTPNWVTVGTPLTAPGTIQANGLSGDLVWQLICTAYTSGTANCYASASQA